MKRPHRSIETFDISLMAVVTKAMGAFLVLMLLLMPYYRSGPIGQKEADALAMKADQVRNSLSVILERLTNASVEDLRALLEATRMQLEEARGLIAKLKQFIDQLNAQVARLDAENTAFKTEIAGLKEKNAALTDKVAELQKQIDPLRMRNAELEQANRTLNARITELQKQIDPLRMRNAELEQANRTLNAKIAELEKIVDPLRRENEALKAKLAELNQIVGPLKRENDALKAKNADLQQLLSERDQQIKMLVESEKRRIKGVIDAADAMKGDADAERKRHSVPPPPLPPETLRPPRGGPAPDQAGEQIKRPVGPADLDRLRQKRQPGGSQVSPSPQTQPGGQN